MNKQGIMFDSFVMPSPEVIAKRIIKTMADVTPVKIVTLHSGLFNEYVNVIRSDVTSGSGFYSPFISCIVSGKVAVV